MFQAHRRPEAGGQVSGTFIKACDECGRTTFHEEFCSEREPTYTLTEVNQIIEGIAVRVEDIECVFDVDYPRTLLLRYEVLETIRSTKL